MEVEFTQDRSLSEEDAKKTRELVAEIAGKFKGENFQVIGSVLMTVVMKWLHAFADPQQRAQMAAAFATTVLGEAGWVEDDEDDDSGPTVQ